MSSDPLGSQQTITATSGEATMMVLIGFFLLLFAALILYLRAKYYRSDTTDTLVLAPDRTATRSCSPLAPSVLKSLPITIFRTEDLKLDCAVCLSDFTDGEEARILPKCGHGFHVGCIDMWFLSNSTCPLCRLPVALTSDSETCVVNISEASSSAACSSSREQSSCSELVV